MRERVSTLPCAISDSHFAKFAANGRYDDKSVATSNITYISENTSKERTVCVPGRPHCIPGTMTRRGRRAAAARFTAPIKTTLQRFQYTKAHSFQHKLGFFCPKSHFLQAREIYVSKSCSSLVMDMQYRIVSGTATNKIV